MARSKQKPVKKRWRKKKPKIVPPGPEEENEDGIVLLVRQSSIIRISAGICFSACGICFPVLACDLSSEQSINEPLYLLT